MIRDANPNDAEPIARIYNHYIEKTIITFEEMPIFAEAMRSRIETITERLPWHVFEIDGRLAGYAYASEWNGRCAYRYSAESTVYLDSDEAGKGIGTQLYRHLLSELESRSFHSVIGGIAILNPASVALHEKCGFRQVALFKEVGWKFERWIDVGYWQIIF